MLDLDHPLTPHIFAAARAEGRVIVSARAITVAARPERIRLRDECRPAFEELRRLARDHFADRPEIPPAINDFERAISELAGLAGVPDELAPTRSRCPACGIRLA